MTGGRTGAQEAACARLDDARQELRGQRAQRAHSLALTHAFGRDVQELAAERATDARDLTGVECQPELMACKHGAPDEVTAHVAGAGSTNRIQLEQLRLWQRTQRALLEGEATQTQPRTLIHERRDRLGIRSRTLETHRAQHTLEHTLSFL